MRRPRAAPHAVNPGRPPRSGLTLIETLLALALTALIAAVLFLTWSAFQRGLAAVAPGADVDGALLRALRETAGAVECAFAGPAGDAALVVTNSGAEIAIRFRAMLRPDGESDPAWADAVDVAVVARPEPGGGGWTVWRTQRPAASPEDAPASTSLVARGLARWHPQAFDGAEWHASWPVAESPPLPLALRLEAATRRPELARSVEVLLPAAQVLKAETADERPGR